MNKCQLSLVIAHWLELRIDWYGSSQYRYWYRYWYMFLDDISADTDILKQRYQPQIPIPIFSISRYLADTRSKGWYKPIFWQISRICHRYLADTDIADIDMPIPIPIYRYRYRPNISENRYIGLSLFHIFLDFSHKKLCPLNWTK